MTAQALQPGRIPGQTFDRWRSCAGKVRHPHWQAAYVAARRMKAKTGDDLTPYACRHCGGIHCGRRST